MTSIATPQPAGPDPPGRGLPARHPYRNPILEAGPTTWPGSTSNDLRAFYDRHYRPDGAVLVIVGDVDPDHAFDRATEHFGAISPGMARSEPRWSEPRQTGRREFTVVDSESVARGLLGWHTVPRGHPDGPALDVLSDLLTCGRRARLWSAAWSSGAGSPPGVEAAREEGAAACRGGQLVLQVEAAPERSLPRRSRATITTILDQLADTGPTPAELVRSRHRLEAAWRWEQEDLAGLAAGLGQVAPWGDWRAWQAEHRAALAVQADDIRRVVLDLPDRHTNLTVGWSLPRPNRAVTVLLPAETAPRARSPPSPAASPAAEAKDDRSSGG